MLKRELTIEEWKAASRLQGRVILQLRQALAGVLLCENLEQAQIMASDILNKESFDG